MKHRINTECIGSGTYTEGREVFCLSCDEYIGRTTSRVPLSRAHLALGVRLGLRPTLPQRSRLVAWHLQRRLAA